MKTSIDLYEQVATEGRQVAELTNLYRHLATLDEGLMWFVYVLFEDEAPVLYWINHCTSQAVRFTGTRLKDHECETYVVDPRKV